MNYGTGCNPDTGHLETLDSVCGAAPAAVTGPMPAEVDPPLSINDQGYRNSCCGNADDKASEWDYWAETGSVIDLSARFSYLTAKVIEGSMAYDNGAQIGSAALAGARFGKCLESTFPYWGPKEPYTPDIPKNALKEGEQHKTGAVYEPKSLDEMLDMLGSGQGASLFGIFWYPSLQSLDIGPDRVVTRVTGHVTENMGHAQAVCGYKTIGGQRIPKIWNSHGTRWNSGGTWLCDPDLLWKLITEAPYGVRTVTKLSGFKARQFKHRDGGYC